jgi:GT2 family glycosyltransferase
LDAIVAPAERLAIIIVAYNSADALPGLLDSIQQHRAEVDRLDVIVIDNDSHDDSVALSQAHPVGAIVVPTRRNGGYAAGINIGAALAGPEAHLLILNPDTRLQPGTMRLLLERIADPHIGVAVPKLLHDDGTLAASLRREPSVITAWSDALVGTAVAARMGLGEIVASKELYEKGGEIEWASGAALLVSAAARRTVGEWDESFFLYSEEVDYLRRIRAAGFAPAYVAEAHVTHKGGAYHESTYLSALMTTNRIRYFRRHHGPLATWAFRMALIVGSTMRTPLGRGHRAALRAALAA